MSQVTIEQVMQIAIGHHRAGRLGDAETIYRQVLAVQPNHPDSLNLLGLIAEQAGHDDSALDLFRRAIAASPYTPDYYLNLGNLLHKQGRFDEALSSFQRTVVLKPDYAEAHDNLGVTWQAKGNWCEAISCHEQALALKPEFVRAHNNLGHALWKTGQLDQAIVCFERALNLEPDYFGASYNLGGVWRDKGRLDEAIACYERTLRVKPDYFDAHINLGNTWRVKGQLDEAIASYQQALALKPGSPEAHNNLGIARHENGQLDEAIVCYERALVLRPDYAEAYDNLGNTWQMKGQPDTAIAYHQRALALNPYLLTAHNNLGNAMRISRQLEQAIACFQRALVIQPDFVQAYNNLANTLSDKGQLDEAIACLRQALTLNPALIEAHDSLIVLLHYHPDYDSKRLFVESKAWNRQHALPVKHVIQPHRSDRGRYRRLRIGYVSPDFREHPVGRFMLPLLASHDRNVFDIFCYSQVRVPDEMTAKLQVHVDTWRSTAGLSDERVAELIRQDQIDILVDLAMHSAGNRLLVFARKPAPIQVTYLAFCSTTGLEAIDYRITDPYLDPIDQGEEDYSEKSIRLPESYWCYQPPLVLDESKATSGPITFGCLNNFCKVTPTTLKTWCDVLRAVPDSQLILHAYEGTHRQRALDVLASHGIDPSRLNFIGFTPLTDYFELYRRIDIALDPFPYAGGTTTCDALWMGVPVVSLKGRTAVGRSGVSILSNIGLSELIASTPEEYVQIAAKLADDQRYLTELRSTLRQRMKNSPLMDARRFARNIEAAYRQMWQKWCQ